MALKRKMNLGFGTNPDNVNLSALSPVSQGQLGGIYEQKENRWQLMQVIDVAGNAGDVGYVSAYDGTYKCTTTIGNSSSGEVAGALPCAVTLNYYTLVRKGGLLNVKANGLFARGTKVSADSGNNRVVPAGNIAGPIALAAVDTGGGVLSWQNPYTDDIFVTRLLLDVTTKTTGACTLDAGATAVSATTSANTFMTALNVGAAAGAFDNYVNAGASGTSMQRVAAGKWVTASKASGASAGIVGSAYIHFIRSASPHAATIGTAQGAINTGKVSTLLEVPYL